MSSKVNSSTIWLDFLNGNRNALKQIYLDCHKPLFQYGMRMLGDQDACRDCIHNLFVKIWTNRKSLKQSNIKYYLIASLRNEIINYRARENRYDHNTEQIESFSLDFSAEHQYIRNEENNEQSRRMAEAMNQLTARQKEIIYLRFFEELDYDQIAEMMNISVKGAYKLSARAIEALKEILNVEKVVLLGMLFAAKNQVWY